MFLQRLKADEKVGFNYDYMGAAEYEFGATANGRVALAKLFIEGKMHAKRIQFVEVHHGHESRPIEVLAIGAEESLKALGNPARIPVIKEPFRTDDAKLIGWMNVGFDRDRTTPLLLARIGNKNSAEVAERIQKFLADPIEYVKIENVSESNT